MAKINADQIKFSGFENMMFNLKRGKGHQLAYLKNRVLYWYLLPKFKILPAYPNHVDIEVSSLCNMACPMCYTMTDSFKHTVKKQLMNTGVFKKIIDECSQKRAFSVRLSLRGESFIHPDIIEMARYAKESGIKEVSSLTNLLSITPAMFEELVKMKFDWLTISFDGLGNTYEKIRKPARFADAYEKIKIFKRIKEKYRAVKPVIKIQTIWPAIANDPAAFYNAMSPYADQIVSNPLSENFGAVTYDYVDTLSCHVLYQRLVITASGEVILCSNDDYGHVIVGDVRKNSLYDIWHGQAYAKARALHKTYGGYKEIICCKECNVARKTKLVEKITMEGNKVKVFEYAAVPSQDKT